MINERVLSAVEFARQVYPEATDPTMLCRMLEIEIIDDRPINKDGYLICESGCKLIFVSSKVSNRHRYNFIVSHEVGHFLMHREHLFCCTNISEISSNVNTPDQEGEANAFASEYLAPTAELRKIIPNRTLSFSDISSIASILDISMTFAAIKTVQNSKTENEILLCYQGNVLKWFFSADQSVHFRQLPVKSPIELSNCNATGDYVGVWDSLYTGSVHQELFSPIAGQYLLLLSGKRQEP